MNVYEMYEANGFRFGFFVRRDTWGSTVAKITAIDKVIEGKPIKGKAPYFGNPKVTAEFYKVDIDDNRNLNETCNESSFVKTANLSCPGNYSYAMCDNITSAYLAEINGDAVIILAENISQALNAIAQTGKEGHLVYQKSLPVIVYDNK